MVARRIKVCAFKVPEVFKLGAKSKGLRCRSRRRLSKHPRERGMRGLGNLLQEYNVGQRVAIDIDPTYIETAPHKRFQGLVGIVTGRRGSAYIVEVFLGNKRKNIITKAEHLKPV